MFFAPGTHDIFIAHAWAYDDEWTQFVALLDGILGSKWRNWSLPWHDPSINRFSEKGNAQVVELLKGQVGSATTFFLLADSIRGGQRIEWLEMQLGMARAAGRQVIGVAPRDGGEFPAEFADRVDTILPFEVAPLAQWFRV